MVFIGPSRVARQLIAFGRLKLGNYVVGVQGQRCRKTTNRLRAIETSFTISCPAQAWDVARQLIAFGRLKHVTEHSRAPVDDGVARQLIAFGRLKPPARWSRALQARSVARQLIAFGRLKLGRSISSGPPTAPVARQLIAFGRLKLTEDVRLLDRTALSQDN